MTHPIGVYVGPEICSGVVHGQSRLFVKTTRKKISPGQIVFAKDVRPASPVEEGVDACRDAIHYDLVEVTWTDHMVAHIPAPFFIEFHGGLQLLLRMPHSPKVRDYSFFSCLMCLSKSYFAGPCRRCQADDTIHESGWINWKKHELRKKRRKDFLLGRLRNGHQVPKTVSKMEYVVSVRRLA